jgi:hypothetical protein
MELTDLTTSPIWYVFCMAMLMGVTHVILGPDHVSALVLLVAGVKRREHDDDNGITTYKTWKESAMQGLRWGLGHTIGLGFMTGIFMAFRSSIPMDEVGRVSDYVVGSMMMFLGIAALYSLYKWVKREQKRVRHITQNDIEISDKNLHPSDGLPMNILVGSQAHNVAHENHLSHVHTTEDGVSDSTTLWERFNKWRMGDTFTDSPTSAYVVGGVHGVSGLSGIVYILPALFLDDTSRLMTYLGGFFMTSILSMTTLAGVMGLIPSGTKKLMVFNGVAGVTVLGVGIMWVILTSMDKLDL